MREPRPGDRVTANVVLTQKLTQGGMGHIWIAEHETLAIEVAVKLLWPDQELSGDALARFLREASLAARVKNPHVVTVFDSGVSELVGPYLVMELLEGEDLEARLADGRTLDLEEASLLFEQVGGAISHAHEVGLVHRDLKPANVFLQRTASNRLFAKVLDFGIAKDFDRPMTEIDAPSFGTPSYMSPEQIMGRDVGPSSDAYALGLIAFRALTGTSAVAREAREALGIGAYKLALPAPSSKKSELPPGLDTWFAKACAFSVSDRFETLEEQTRDLVAVLRAPHVRTTVTANESERTLAPRPAVAPPERTVPAKGRTVPLAAWILGLGVVRLDGGRAGFLRAFARSLQICLLVPPLIWDKDTRGLHDRSMGTVLVRR